ncbi:MAG: phosphomannomutase, partial [Candidatus Thermoplasmatota archaeon]
VIDEYIGYIRKRIKIKKEIKVVLDLGNSACALTAPLLFKKGGINVKTINSNIDGTFPGRGPNPTYQNLSELCENVLKNKADYGAAYDGDGDRVIFVDNKGRIAQTEKIGIILAREILKESKGNVLVNAPCSMIVEEEIEKFSGKVIRVRVGDVFVCEAIKKYGAVFGMEISAHFFIPSFYIFDDGVLTSYKLAEILSKKEKKLSELLDELPSYPIVEKEYKCSDETKFSIIEDMKAEYLRKGLKVDLIDGLKVIYDEGWIMVRASNTQPIIRLFAEAKSEVFLQKLLRQFEDELRERIR